MQPSSVAEPPRHRLARSPANIEVIRWSEPTVEMNLALDEKLARCAGQTGRRIVRLWWGGDPTVVLGCGDKPESALDLEECRRRGIGWVKRTTGGGTVLQTPGVLNYSYTAPDPGCLDVRRAFEQGMRLIVRALAGLGVDGQHRGTSDVVVGDRKISGNAQARKWRAILLHGTLLVDVDRDLMRAVLKHPLKEPDYRRGRAHSDFVVTLDDLGIAADRVLIEDVLASAAVEAFVHE